MFNRKRKNFRTPKGESLLIYLKKVINREDVYIEAYEKDIKALMEKTNLNRETIVEEMYKILEQLRPFRGFNKD